MHKKINLPLVSIIIPCYNHEQFVQETIQSIIEQDYQNIELIIIDDGSQDNSVSKIKEMIPECKKRFARFEFRHRPNKGLCATLNEGLYWCNGLYYSPSASDDILYSSKISTQVDTFKNSNEHIAGVFTGISIINKNKEIKNTKGNNTQFGFNDIILRKYLMPGQTVMLKTSILKEVGGYDESILFEDLDLFLRIGYKNYFFQSIPTPLVFYRKHGNNLSNKHEEMLTATLLILNKYKNHPLHNKAISKSIMIEAHGVQQQNKKKSIPYMKKALKKHPINIFSLSFIKYVIKFLLPN